MAPATAQPRPLCPQGQVVVEAALIELASTGGDSARSTDAPVHARRACRRLRYGLLSGRAGTRPERARGRSWARWTLSSLMSPLALTGAWAFRTLNARGVRAQARIHETGGVDGAVAFVRARSR